MSRPAVVERVRVSHVLAVGAALAVAGVASTGTLAFGVAAVGCLAFVAGLAFEWRSAVVVGGAVLFVASLVVAATTGTVLTVLLGAFGAVLAADLGEFALGLDRDVDPSVATTRVELLHAVGSVTVALLAAGVGYALFLSAPTGSAIGVVALLFAAVVLAAVLRA